jgi:cyclopropane-fatty-acyl-phospholipid synthase
VPDRLSEILPALRRRWASHSSPTLRPFAVSDGATGSEHGIGTGDPAFTIIVADEEGVRALASLDQFTIAVAYLEGHLDVAGDLLAALAMRGLFHDRHPLAYASRFVKPLLKGQVRSDRQFIASHYDLDNDFFLTFLDTRHRCYTHGLFERDDEKLEDAMTRKMDLALDEIGVRPGDEVLEVGGGWGAFAEHAARRGIGVTTLTISAESERFLLDLAAREDLPITVVKEHVYRYVPGRRFAAIVNMGVTEHLPDYPATVRAYQRLLRPGGKIYLDAVAARAKHRVSTFMSRYIYPGNASPMVLQDYVRAVARSPFELISVHEDRHNYFLTCRDWGERLDAARDQIVRRWGEPLYRRFRLFLWGSAAGFAIGDVLAYRWVLQLPDPATLVPPPSA